MTFKHDPLSTSDPEEEDPQAILVGTTTTTNPSSTTMEPMSIDDGSDGNNDGENGLVQGSSWAEGQQTEPPAYRNTCFAVIFVLQLLAVTVVAFAVGVPRLEHIGAVPHNDVPHNDDLVWDNDNDHSKASGGNGSTGIALLLMFFGVSALAAIGLSGLSVYLMRRYSESFVMGALVGCPVSFAVLGLILLFHDNEEIATLWFTIALFSGLCGCWYWSHIPFASANLQTGLAAVSAHGGVVSVSFLMALLGSVFSIVWLVAVSAVSLSAPIACDEQEAVVNDDLHEISINCPNDNTNVYLFLLVLSYYWTLSTLRAITRVTVAGTVGTWWFEPEGRTSCCSNAVLDSLMRSVTYSFGSVCLGSLIVGIVQTLRRFCRPKFRPCQDKDGCLLGNIECLFGCMPGFLKSINEWAYVYVGLYGYGFIHSAKKVLILFHSRGWTTGFTNSLVVILVNLTVGALTGVVSLVVGYAAFGDFNVFFYCVGVVFGIVLASITLTVVDGAVKTSIVCFAEAPRELEVNHPELYRSMTSAYDKYRPTVILDVVEMMPVAATTSGRTGAVPVQLA